MYDHTGGTYSHSGVVGYPRFPISELHLSVARLWKGAAFTEKMNAAFDDDEFTAVDAEPNNKQSNNPPPEFTSTKPNEFKSYREKVRRWLLFMRTPAQLQGPHVSSRLTGAPRMLVTNWNPKMLPLQME